MNKIAVVNSKSFGVYFPKHLDYLNDLGGVDVLDISSNIPQLKLAEELKQYEFIIASVTPNFEKPFFENSPNLKLIARHGLGFNSIDIDAATDSGVYITKVSGIIEQEAVAELSIALIMALVRKTPQADKSLRTREWGVRSEHMGIEVKNSTVGVIGFGNIGSRVGEILKYGFKANVIVHDPNLSAEYLESKGVKKVTLDELVTESDIISLNASANESNYQMIGEIEIAKMKDNVLIVNTARGHLVDEKALADALKSNKIGGYGADVFDVEPIEKDNPLLDSPNTVLSQHIGAYTYPSIEGMGDKCVSDVELVMNGKKPNEIVNEEVKGVND